MCVNDERNPNPFKSSLLAAIAPDARQDEKRADTSAAETNARAKGGGEKPAVKGGAIVGAADPDEPTKPKRPLNAYNFFFSYMRGRFLQLSEERGEDFTWHDLLAIPLHVTFEDVRAVLESSACLINGPKRRHRRSHGKISFGELTQIVSAGWKSLSADSKNAFYQVAHMHRAKYDEDMAEYKRVLMAIRQRKGKELLQGGDREGTKEEPSAAPDNNDSEICDKERKESVPADRSEKMKDKPSISTTDKKDTNTDHVVRAGPVLLANKTKALFPAASSPRGGGTRKHTVRRRRSYDVPRKQSHAKKACISKKGRRKSAPSVAIAPLIPEHLPTMVGVESAAAAATAMAEAEMPGTAYEEPPHASTQSGELQSIEPIPVLPAKDADAMRPLFSLPLPIPQTPTGTHSTAASTRPQQDLNDNGSYASSAFQEEIGTDDSWMDDISEVLLDHDSIGLPDHDSIERDILSAMEQLDSKQNRCAHCGRCSPFHSTFLPSAPYPAASTSAQSSGAPIYEFLVPSHNEVQTKATMGEITWL